jgi:probable rRNA maturation factor
MGRPEFSLYNHQQALALDLTRLTDLAVVACPLVVAVPGTGEPVLPDLAEVEVSFINDKTIARVHAEFLEDPTPTDVITFAHGEILISTETAIRQAAEYGQNPLRETALYLIHGLLHLNGHEDSTEAGFAMMKQLQEEILGKLWPVEC